MSISEIKGNTVERNSNFHRAKLLQRLVIFLSCKKRKVNQKLFPLSIGTTILNNLDHEQSSYRGCPFSLLAKKG